MILGQERTLGKRERDQELTAKDLSLWGPLGALHRLGLPGTLHISLLVTGFFSELLPYSDVECESVSVLPDLV